MYRNSILNISFFFTDENTREKFLFFGGPDCLHIEDGLSHYMPTETIPDFLGGPCTVCFKDFMEKNFCCKNYLIGT